MIPKKKAQELCRKLVGMVQTPTDAADIAMRVDALTARAGSEQHAKLVIDSIVERETFYPSVAVIVQSCAAITDPVGSDAKLAREKCPYCMGDGFRTVEGPYGTSAAYPCNHQPEGDPRMGVRIPAAVESHYQAEARAAPALRKAADESPANPSHPGHPHQRRMRERELALRRAMVPEAAKAIVQAEIDAVKQAQEANRRGA
jgi:hypothetical protein